MERNFVGTLLSFIITFLLINVLLLGGGIGIGYLLNWILPRVDLGIAILIGIVSTSVSAHFIGRLSSLPDIEEEDEADDTPIRVYAFEPPRRGRKSRRK